MRYKHSFADPEYLIEANYFYSKVASDGRFADAVHTVHRLAREKGYPFADEAGEIGTAVASSPPDFESHEDLKDYLSRMVISRVPRKCLFSDVFWCCFLSVIDSSNAPECSVGGPIHSLIYEIYDDFDPWDVLDG